MTYNMIHGWDQEGKDSTANRTIEYIKNCGADIVAVQELVQLDSLEVPNLTAAQKDELLKVYPFFVGDPSNDMKVFSKYPVVFENGYNYIEGTFDKKRYTFYKLNINGHRLTLINVHLMSFMLSSEDISEVTGMRKIGGFEKGVSAMRSDPRETHRRIQETQI